VYNLIARRLGPIWSGQATVGRNGRLLSVLRSPRDPAAGADRGTSGTERLLSVRALSGGYAGPQGLLFYAASRWGPRRPRRSPGLDCHFLGLHFEFLLAFSREVSSWRLFLIADARAAFRRTRAGAGPRCANKGVLSEDDPRVRAGQSPGTSTGNKDRPIDPVSGKKASASQRARSGFRALASGRAPALHALRVSHNPCLRILISSVSPITRWMRPILSGRLDERAIGHPLIADAISAGGALSD
jgi:hypothetical protein